jgi:general secretion pathway protein L
MVTDIATSRLNPLRFLFWWRDELAALIPASLRRSLGRRERLLVLERSPESLTAYQRVGEREHEVGRIALDAAADLGRHRLGDILAKAKRAGTPSVLRLPATGVLERHLELPAAADADLRRILYFEIDRQTPFRPEETYFDYKVTERHAGGKRQSVELVIVPRKVVEDCIAEFGDLGLAPDFVEVAPTAGRPMTRISLRGADEKSGHFGFGSLINALLILVIVAELAVAIRIPLEARRETAALLATEVNQARDRAEATREKQKELDQILATRRRLQQKKLETPSVSATLEELTRLLPDNVWLTNLQFADGEVRLTGYATAAATLVALIDASPMFQTPKFNAPVTQDAQIGKERFSLSFKLEPKGIAAK